MVTAIVSGVAAILPLVSGIKNKKDPERFATAESLYYAAKGGDPDALCQLKYFSGRFGTSPGCGKYGKGTSGFSTYVAKQYAYDLYVQAQGIVNGDVTPAVQMPPRPQPGGAVDIPRVADDIANVSSVTGGVSSALGSPNAQEQQRNLLILILLAVGTVLVVRTLAR